MISKILNFTPPSPQTALMVADTNSDYYFNFEQANEDAITLLPPSMTIQRVYRPACNPPYMTYCSPDTASAAASVVADFNQGPAIVNYSGHGNVDIWRGTIFDTMAAQNLNNGTKLPLVIVNDCLNSYFIEPNPAGQGIAEALIKNSNGGAVATFASSGETIPDGQHLMAEQLYTLLYGAQPITIGDAIIEAKAPPFDRDVGRQLRPL